jgi:hypothetical protein
MVQSKTIQRRGSIRNAQKEITRCSMYLTGRSCDKNEEFNDECTQSSFSIKNKVLVTLHQEPPAHIYPEYIQTIHLVSQGEKSSTPLFVITKVVFICYLLYPILIDEQRIATLLRNESLARRLPLDDKI